MSTAGPGHTPVAPASPAGDPVLEAHDVVRSFGERQALRGLSLDVRRGEIYLLLGPNGAGKTSLVRALCGRLALDSGSVRIGGIDPRGNRAARRRLGLVPQEIALYHELTAGENLEIFGRLAGVSRSGLPTAVRDALQWSGLDSRRDDPVASLSGGMQRRLNLAAGILHRPDALILDEPTVGVDPASREAILQLLSDLRSRGLGILLTTHDLDLAEQLADRIGIIADGRIRGEGTLASLVRDIFAELQELSVTLRKAPGSEDRAHLLAEGLTPAHGERFWSGALDGGLEAMSRMGRRLEQWQLDIDEIRVREPGLRGVFFQLTGREFER